MLYTLIATTGAADVDLSELAFNGQLVQSVNAIDKLTFCIPRTVGTVMQPMQTVVRLLKNESLEFYGRVIRVEPNMQQTGEVYDSITCEAWLGVLHDSVQPFTEPVLYEDTPEKSGLQLFLEALLAVHNSQVEPAKRVTVGSVTVQTNISNTQVYKGTNWASTWDTINEKLIKVYGGELQLRQVDGTWLLDYRDKIGTLRNTAIALKANQISLQRTTDAASVITRLYPLGCKLTKKDLDGNEEQTDERLTIAGSSFPAAACLSRVKRAWNHSACSPVR